MIAVNDIVVLEHHGLASHGLRHLVTEVRIIDISARGGVPVEMAVCRCLDSGTVNEMAYPLDWLRTIGREKNPARPAPENVAVLDMKP